jgi:hypothetical protein
MAIRLEAIDEGITIEKLVELFDLANQSMAVVSKAGGAPTR